MLHVAMQYNNVTVFTNNSFTLNFWIAGELKMYDSLKLPIRKKWFVKVDVMTDKSREIQEPKKS